MRTRIQGGGASERPAIASDRKFPKGESAFVLKLIKRDFESAASGASGSAHRQYKPLLRRCSQRRPLESFRVELARLIDGISANLTNRSLTW